MNKWVLPIGLCVVGFAVCADAAVWQWSVPVGEGGRAFLWIPEDCERVRAVVVGQHNMLEEGILEHGVFRREMGVLGIAEIWIVPPVDVVFRFDEGAGDWFDAMLAGLAEASGYGELARAPVAPLGHSACASYPWNFAAWAPERTLAVLSVKGDAPLTPMTGSGRPHPDWGGRTIEGIPGLMVMGEYEWIVGRYTPALAYMAAHPGAPIAMLAEPGRGHFDSSDRLVNFLALFLRKAMAYRYPADAGDPGAPAVLKPVDPAAGWRVQAWTLNAPRTVPPAPAAAYTGNPGESFWCFDEETAWAVQEHAAEQIGRRPMLLGFVEAGEIVPQTESHQQVSLHPVLEEDGMSFRLEATFLSKVGAGSSNLARWTQLPAAAPLGHPVDAEPIRFSRITGPVEQTGPETFRIRLNRTWSTVDRRNQDVWLLAQHPGDAEYRSAVQQALWRLEPVREGDPQVLSFPPIPDVEAGTASLELHAESSAGVEVQYYVREGPAEVEGSRLVFSALPSRSRYPVAVTVVAWQWGRAGDPGLCTAAPVERTFHIRRAEGQ